jgi:hypothetical protein
MATNEASQPKWRIGFYPGAPEIRMEEEEGPAPGTADYGRAAPIDEAVNENIAELLRQRRQIIDAMDVPKLTTEEKFKLLEETAQIVGQLRGRDRARFATEKIIYGILIFSGLVIVVLSLLTAFADLPQEVTITFVGTVVGGAIATIAQKLGKVGR